MRYAIQREDPKTPGTVEIVTDDDGETLLFDTPWEARAFLLEHTSPTERRPYQWSFPAAVDAPATSGI